MSLVRMVLVGPLQVLLNLNVPGSSDVSAGSMDVFSLFDHTWLITGF